MLNRKFRSREGTGVKPSPDIIVSTDLPVSAWVGRKTSLVSTAVRLISKNPKGGGNLKEQNLGGGIRGITRSRLSGIKNLQFVMSLFTRQAWPF